MGDSNNILKESQKMVWDNNQPTIIQDKTFKRDALTSISKSAYAISHFSNDLCAAAWFTYVLYYVKEVVGLNDYISGFVILSGQIADAITTPIVGFYSD